MGKAHRALRWLRRTFALLAVIIAVGAFGGILLRGFVEGREQAANDAGHDLPIKPPPRVITLAGQQPIISLDSESQSKSGIKIEPAQPTDYRERIRAYGTVLDMASLTSLSTSHISAVSQVKVAEAKLAASKAAYERAKTLYQNRSGNLAQSEVAEAAYRSDAAGLVAAQSQAQTIAATAIQEWGRTIGAALLEGSPLVQRLIDRQDILIQVTLPPGLSAEPPSTAEVEIGGASAMVDARLISAAPRTDPKIQGLSFFYIAPANKGLLPGMSAVAFLNAGEQTAGVTIPQSAVIWHAGKSWVYLRAAPGRFTRLAIPARNYESANGAIVVPQALLPGKAPSIVTEGAQVLLSEEFRAEVQVGEDPNQ